jgi:hypothetical protein
MKSIYKFTLYETEPIVSWGYENKRMLLRVGQVFEDFLICLLAEEIFPKYKKDFCRNCDFIVIEKIVNK